MPKKDTTQLIYVASESLIRMYAK